MPQCHPSATLTLLWLPPPPCSGGIAKPQCWGVMEAEADWCGCCGPPFFPNCLHGGLGTVALLMYLSAILSVRPRAEYPSSSWSDAAKRETAQSASKGHVEGAGMGGSRSVITEQLLLLQSCSMIWGENGVSL